MKPAFVESLLWFDGEKKHHRSPAFVQEVEATTRDGKTESYRIAAVQESDGSYLPTDPRTGLGYTGVKVSTAKAAFKAAADRIGMCRDHQVMRDILNQYPDSEQLLVQYALEAEEFIRRRQLWLDLINPHGKYKEHHLDKALKLDGLSAYFGKCSIDVIKLDDYVKPRHGQSTAQRCEELFGKEVAKLIKSLI